MVSFLVSYAFKDLWRQKVRTIFGIFGIAISILLLSTVSFAMDSLSNSFVDYLTSESGNQDITLEVRHYYGEPDNRTNYFHYNPVIQQLRENVSEVEHFLPRTHFSGWSKGRNSNPVENALGFRITSMNLTLEENLKFGKWENLNDEVDPANGLPINSCMVDPNVLEELNASVGDEVKIYVNQLNANISMTVISTFGHTLKFPSGETPSIVVDNSWWGESADKVNQNSKYEGFSFVGATNQLVLLLRDAQNLYDIRDIEGSEIKIENIGADVVNTLGIEAWELDYPKLDLLFVSEYMAMVMNMIFMVMTIIAMLISGILIHGILTTSVEEKIQEYGINRVLGAHSSYNFKMILMQGTILALAGTTLGVIGALLLVKYLAIPVIQGLLIENGVYATIQFVINPTSVIVSYAIGVGVSLVVSLSPAFKVKKMNIVESINPYRHSEELYQLKEKETLNKRLIFFGAILAFNGLFVYYIIPQALLSLDIQLIAGLLIGTLLVFLIGVSLLAIGLMPVLIRIFIRVFAPISKKFMSIVKINVHRHQRRNTSTIVILILSFSFIMFTTSTVEIQVEQVSELIEFQRASDIQVVPRQYDLFTPTVDLEHQLMEVEKIERTSALLASTWDLEQIFFEQGKDFDVSLGDYINFNSLDIRLYGIDENYKDIVYNPQSIVFSEGNKEEAFDKVFKEEKDNIIISTAIATELDLHLGDSARINVQRGDEQEVVITTIVGVASSMPGLNRFKENVNQAYDGGVICSDDNYIKYFNIPGGDEAYIDRIFVKVKEGVNHDEVEKEIDGILGEDHNLAIRSTQDTIVGAEQQFKVIQYLFVAILGGTIVIGMFGLIASAYSSIIERKREIGIVRTLGLHGDEVTRLFTIENMILFLASSSAGGLIGFTMSALLTRNMIIFTETPIRVSIPWNIVALVYGFGIIFLLVGMRLLMRKLKKKNLIEIFRETL